VDLPADGFKILCGKDGVWLKQRSYSLIYFFCAEAYHGSSTGTLESYQY